MKSWPQVLAWGVVGFLAAAAGLHAGPVITREQIEADWLRQDELRRPVAPGQSAGLPAVSVEEDASGGVDGVTTGEWGFHTQNEAHPWWQVDLGSPVALDRVVLYNRCDDCGRRNTQILVLLSDDGRQFRQAYQHDGTMFYGHTDKKPLVVKLTGQTARYLRLQHPGTSYFHLDEVQVFAAGKDENIALGRPATQSSISQWSKPLRQPAGAALAAQPARVYPTPTVVERGLKLAADLGSRGAAVQAYEEQLQQLAQQCRTLPADAPDAARRAVYLQARWTVRQLALSNPLLDFDQLVFVKRAPTLFPHMSDQYYGWWSRGGGGLYVLSGFKGEQPQLRCLTETFATGNFLLPDLSYDGRRVLFSYCKHYPELSAVADKTKKDELPEDAFYHVFEINVDGTGLRQLTHGRYDDFDAHYLPSGEIVFLSTRKGLALQAGRDSAAATCAETHPDSYVRCGGGKHRPVAVFTLHKMAADGGHVQAISAFENFEWNPAVDADGRIIYARWDYIDRFNGPFISLWATNPDGTNAQLVYGNYTVRPQCVFEARPVPNSRKLMFTASAHHSINGGSLALLDRTQGTEFERPLTRLTPDACFPETEGWPAGYYGGPWPLAEEHFLCSWADKPLPPHSLMPPDDPRNPPNASGIYLGDAFGNLNLLYRDPDISATNPLAVGRRPKPPQLPDLVEKDAPAEGRFLVQNVYEGLGLEPGTVSRLRIVAVIPKVQPEMNSPVLGVSREDTGKFVLGTVPVEPDGSAYFRVPSGMPYFFQALDRDGLALQTMRSLTYVQPNQTLACVGCHESRDFTPLAGRPPLAMLREPSRIKLDPDGSWPLRYDQLVQPVLDKLCVSCHRPGASDAAGAKFDLTAAQSYESLLHYAGDDLQKLAFEKDFSAVGDCPARQSKLLALLTAGAGHKDVKLDADSRQRLAVWMDTYANRQGAFSPEQEEALRQFRTRVAGLLEP